MADERLAERAVALLSDAATRLRADREHGASWLAREAAAALGESAARATGASPPPGTVPERDLHAWREAARELARARPSMAAVATTVARACAAGWPRGTAAASAAEPLARVRAEADRLVRAWGETAEAIATHASPLLTGRVLTHSRSGTVERVLSRLADAGNTRSLRGVVVTTSMPGGEGIALARVLAERGIGVTLVADAAMGWAVAEVDAIVLGADSLRADGSLVNKVGSLPLALCARHAGVPVYVLCERLKVAPTSWPLTLEEMDPAELLPAGEPHLHARNVYFDRTPADLITTVITEAGPTTRQEIARLSALAARDLAALEVG